MKKKIKLCFVAVLTLIFSLQLTAFAAEPVSIVACVITGDQVQVAAAGAVQPSDSGQYYLFALEPYETSVGARTDYCAAVPASDNVMFTTDLNLNNASSKLYSRFVVTALRGGVYVPISNEMYLTNPEAVATVSTGYPARSKKGVIADWRYASDLTDLNAGYAIYVLDISKFVQSGGTNYTYNGKNYSFSSTAVAEYDAACSIFAEQGCNVVMVVANYYNPATVDMIPPMGRTPGMTTYAFNVQEQAPTEKLEALMSFLAERYDGSGHGVIHSWIIGNEVNNNYPAHYQGNISADEFATDYAKQFRVCYNAIKSHNKDARVYTDIDQRWNWVDTSSPLQYPSRTFLDKFAAAITETGNIDWGLTIHPHPVPMDNCRFWELPGAYAAMNLVKHSDDSKFATVQNMEVFTNHMKQPALLSPNGTVRHMMITELGFNASEASPYGSNEQYQAAALVYAYKKAMSLPEIEAFIVHKQHDDAAEAASPVSYGLRVGDRKRYAYDVFKFMDTGNTAYTDFALPLIGASSWAQLGLQ
ncbi:MAG: hypothetical protein K1W16_04175 [Lachnospiraceae bacterium]